MKTCGGYYVQAGPREEASVGDREFEGRGKRGLQGGSKSPGGKCKDRATEAKSRPGGKVRLEALPERGGRGPDGETRQGGLGWQPGCRGRAPVGRQHLARCMTGAMGAGGERAQVSTEEGAGERACWGDTAPTAEAIRGPPPCAGPAPSRGGGALCSDRAPSPRLLRRKPGLRGGKARGPPPAPELLGRGRG